MITSHDYFIPAECLQKQWSIIIFNLLIVYVISFATVLNGLNLAIL